MYRFLFLQEFSENLKINGKAKELKPKRRKNLNIDRILLGPLTKDTQFLKKLVDDPKLIIKRKDMYGEDVRDTCQDEVKL